MPRATHDAKAFTLTELLLAVLVLLVVIAATARIFGTAQRVSSVGEANASILQDAGAIERRLRDDLARMSDKGYMAIRNFAVRNDINDDPATSGQKELLNPELAEDAILRLDQLVFFTEGAAQTVDLIGGANLSAIDPTTNRRVVGYMPSSVVSRVTYGHGVQVGNRTAQSNPASRLYDPDFYLDNEQKWLSPWLVDRVPNGPGLRLLTNPSGQAISPNVYGTQPAARDWILSRRAMLLADDGDGNSNYLGIRPGTDQLTDPNSVPSLLTGYANGALLRPSPGYLSGRFDVSAMRVTDLERILGRFDWSGDFNVPPYYAPWVVVPGVVEVSTSQPDARPFGVVRQRVINATFGFLPSASQGGIPYGLASWPRVEREPPSIASDVIQKRDQMLTAGMIAGHCSNFIVEWCWKDGVGRVMEDDRRVKLALDPVIGNGTVPMLGFLAPTNGVAPWIGLPDRVDSLGFLVPLNQRRGTRTLEEVGGLAAPLYAPSIEGPAGAQVLAVVGGGIPPQSAWSYTSVFGFNGTEPTFRVRSNQNPVTGAVIAGQPTDWVVPRLDYTPRPSAVRITMTLHDPDRRIDGGREFTFVIDLPERSKP